MAGRPDIVLVSLGTTMGLREADEALVRQLRAAGASCEIARVRIGASGRLRRTMALTDLVEGLAARRAAGRGAGAEAGAIVYSSVTAALLVPARAPAAVRFDATATLNRPGWGGAWQRRRERTVLGRATLLLPWSEAAARAAADVVERGPVPAERAAADVVGRGPVPAERAAGVERELAPAPAIVVLPPPVPFVDHAQRPAAGAPEVVAYAGDPLKRGIDLLFEAWRLERPDGARLAIGGIEPGEARRRLRQAGVEAPPEVEWLGPLTRERWLARVARARVFVNASRHEDWGLAQMEALSAGTPLVTVPSGGASAAFSLARELAPALVASERTAGALARALRAALELDAPARDAYARAAAQLLEPYREQALARRVSEEVLPRLLDPARGRARSSSS